MICLGFFSPSTNATIMTTSQELCQPKIKVKTIARSGVLAKHCKFFKQIC